MSVCEYFDSGALFWKDIYDAEDVYAVIHQERRAVVMSMVDKLRLPARSEVLEIGCGAGVASVALAQRGLKVEATDVAPAMLELTRKLAAEARVDDLVHTSQCDIYALPYPSDSFPLVVALGVLPWLPSLDEAMRAMARVLRPGGYLILTMDNCLRLNHVLHPFAWAGVAGLRVPDRFAFWRRQRNEPEAKMYFLSDFEQRLPGYGLEKIAGLTLGFGPFWGISHMLPASAGVKLHRILQGLANRGIPPFRSTGSQYIAVLRAVS